MPDSSAERIRIGKKNYESYFSEDFTRSSPEKIAVLLHEFITANYQQSLNFGVISQMMNYSQSYLTKAFLQEYDCTPMKYLNQIRLQKACYLLLNSPEMTINQIAELTGYENQGYFSRIFKKNMGVSPLQYKKNHNCSV